MNTLSPEARSLIERTINWFTPKGRWITGAYGKKRGFSLDKTDIRDRYIRIYDYSLEKYVIDSENEIDQACLIGGLLWNSDGNDEAYREAVKYLGDLAEKSKMKFNRPDEAHYLGYDPVERKEDILINLNDHSNNKTRIMRFLKEAIGK